MEGRDGIVSLRLSRFIFLLLVSTITSPRINSLLEKLNLSRPRSTFHLRCSVASWRVVWSSCISHRAALVGLLFLDHICHGWRETARERKTERERAERERERELCKLFSATSAATLGILSHAKAVLVFVVCFWSSGSEWEESSVFATFQSGRDRATDGSLCCVLLQCESREQRAGLMSPRKKK